MPDILTPAAKHILRVQFKQCEKFHQSNGFIKLPNLKLRRKGSVKTDTQLEKGKFFSELVENKNQYVIFCGSASKQAFDALKANTRFVVLHLLQQDKVSENDIHDLRSLLEKLELPAATLCTENNYTGDSIIAFAIFCYQALKLKFQQPAILCDILNLPFFLNNAATLYDEFSKQYSANTNAKQFTQAIELVIQLISYSRSEPFLDVELSVINSVFVDAHKKQTDTVSLAIVNSFFERPSSENFPYALEAFNYLIDSYESKKQSFDGFAKRLASIVPEITFTQTMQLAKKLPSQYRFQFNLANIANIFEQEAIRWQKEGKLFEAKTWFILAYLLTNDAQKKVDLWKTLASDAFKATWHQGPKTSSNTMGKAILFDIENSVLENNLHNPKCAYELFKIYKKMFISSGLSIVDKVTTKDTDQKKFLLNDKAQAALIYWVIYAQASKPNKKKILKELTPFLEAANNLTESDAQQDLFDQLAVIVKLPQNCLDLFPQPYANVASAAVPQCK